MTARILILVIEFTIQTVFLLTALWIMIKLQKLNYNFLGLLGAAVLASLLDMIPIVGHPLSVGALLLCIWKVTQSEYVDVAFTVFVGYALMFGMNLWLIGALMGDLRPSARSADEDDTSTELPAEYHPATNQSSPPMPAPATNMTAGKFAAGQNSGTNMASTNVVKPAPLTPAEAIAKDISLKGLSRNSTNSSLVLNTGVKTYTLLLGESRLLDTRTGNSPVRFEELGEDWVVLNIDGEPVRLSLH